MERSLAKKRHGDGVQGLGGPIQLYPRRLLYSAESRDRTGSQHDIQCSEPAAVVTASSSQRIAHEDRSAAANWRYA